MRGNLRTDGQYERPRHRWPSSSIALAKKSDRECNDKGQPEELTINKTSPDMNPHLHSSSPANEIDAERATLSLAAADQVGKRDDNSSYQLLGGGGDAGRSASPTRVMLHSPTLYPSLPPFFPPNKLADGLDLDDGRSVSVNSGPSRQLGDTPQVSSARKDLDLNPTPQSTEIPLNDQLQQDPIVSERSGLMGVSEIRRNSVSSAAFLAPQLYEQTEAGERSRAVDYMFELWLVMYDRIGPIKEAITTSWFTDGLERFAIRIGLESAHQVNRDISEFIYENRSIISAYFDLLCDFFDSEEKLHAEFVQSGGRSLSLKEKLGMWGLESYRSFIFMDLGGIAMNRGWKTSQMPDLTTYHQAIVESASFQRLIDDIQVDKSLQESLWESFWDTPRRKLRTAIHDRLSLRSSYETQHLKVYEVLFRFWGWSLGNETNPQACINSLFSSVVVMCSGGDAQAATVDNYISQTWQSSWGRAFFSQLRTSVPSTKMEGEIRVANLPDHTEVFMSMEGANMIFRVRGPSFAVVDCGDQLSWLYSVSKAAHDDSGVPVELAPVIVDTDERNLTADSHALGWKRSQTIDINSQQILTLSATELQFWSRMLRSRFAIASGYPILRRPKGYSGLELTWALLLDGLGKGVSVEGLDYDVVLRGPIKSLALVNAAEDIYIWHETCFSSSTCKCAAGWANSLGTRRFRFHPKKMESGRHFVQICDKQLCTGDGIPNTKPAATLDGKTDSGYASQNADARREDRAANFSQAPESIGECSNLDAQTSYSMLAGVNPDSVQHYVSDLSDSLSSKIGKYLDFKSWPSVLRVLPGRLKAFAMQIGQEARTQENRYIMWFIHRHHKKIVRRIKADFSEICEPNVRELVRPSHEVMPLDEKFHRWNIQVEQSPCRREESVPNAFLAHAQQIETDASQKGIGENDTDGGSEVSGEDSEGPGPKGQPTKFTHGEQDADIHIGQQKYEGIVLQSEAYQRLVSGLKNISALEWEDHPEATYVGEDIQQAILRKLPTGRISSQQGPRVHVAKFWISRKETHDETELDEDEEDSWIDSIVVIGCGNKAQAISIKSYVFQTWPATGPAILELFQVLIDRSYNKAPMPGYFSIVPELRQRFKIVLPDQTGISVTWGNMNWVVTVTGLAHAVAECGQQLAWMVAAIRSATTEASGRVTPVVIERVGETPVSHRFLSETRAHAVSFDLDICSAGAPEFLGNHSYENILGSSASIIHGFPIRRRTIDSPGLEIPSEYLWKLTGAHVISIEANRVRIRGSQTTFTLVRHTSDTLLWHRSTDTHLPCKCYIGKVVFHRDIPFGLSNLKEFHHIIDFCTVNELVNEASYSSTRSSILQDHRTTSQFSGAIQRSFGKSELVTTELSSSSNALYMKFAEQFGNGHEHDYSSSSLDSDLLSMSDSSGENDLLDGHDELRPVIDILVSRLIAGYRSFAGGDSASSNSRGSASLYQCQNATDFRNAAKKAKGKRPQSEEPDSDEDKNRPPPAKKAKIGLSKPFSCPFLKMCPSKHSSCAKYTLNGISRVKQHLLRKHTPTAYCRRCLTIFPDDTLLTQHVSRPQGFHCQLATDGTRLHGITSDQSKLLSKKSKKELSEQQQWFAIWDIVFPGLERPSSPHPDPGLEREMSAFREYCRGHEEGIVENLLNSGIADPSISEDSRKQLARMVLIEGLDELCSQWSPSHFLGTMAPRHITALQTPATSLGDSALSASNLSSNNLTLPGLFTASNSVSEESQIRLSGETLSSMDKAGTPLESGGLWPNGCQNANQLHLDPLDEFSVENFTRMFQEPDELGTFCFDIPEICLPDIEQP